MKVYILSKGLGAEFIQVLKQESILYDISSHPRDLIESIPYYQDAYDAIIIHDHVDDMSLLSIIKDLRVAGVSLPLFVLMETYNTQTAISVLDAGADAHQDILRLDELPAILRSLVRRSVGLSSAMLQKGDLLINLANKVVTYKDKTVRLTSTEYKILSLLARRDIVYTRSQIIEKTYGSGVHVNDRSIDTHIKRMRKKFKGAGCTSDLFIALYNVGYKFAHNH